MFNHLEKYSILWLSDIHFKSEYDASESKNIEKYLGSFVSKLEEFKKDQLRINYLILSGDIAMDGSKEAYSNFKLNILDRIKGIFPEIIVIPCPGNHDVLYYDQFEFPKTEELKNFIWNYKDHFKKNRKLFDNLFTNYKDSWGIRSKDYQKFEKIEAIETCKNYEENRDFGYFADLKNKVIFIVLNSSWFSLGTKFDSILIEKIKSKKISIEDAFKFKSSFAEFGNQTIGEIKYLTDEVYKDKYNDYLKIIIQHHPMHWLKWEEVNNLDSDDTDLIKLYKKGDFLLTGHEHLPSNAVIDTFGQIQNLKAGQFLSHNFTDDFKRDFNNNRFQLINVNHDKNNIECQIFAFQKNYSNNKYEFQHFNSENQQKCEYKTTEIKFVDGLITELKKSYSRTSCTDDFYFEIKANWLYIYPKSGSFLETIKSEKVIELIYNIILQEVVFKEEEEKRIYVKFVLHDVFAFINSAGMYIRKGNKVNELVFNEIICICEKHFEIFQNKFFNWVCENVEEESNIIIRTSKIAFINEIIPFWHKI